MGVIRRILGTISSIFQIGEDGPKLKNNSGVLEIRNDADSAFATLRAASPVGADDVVTKTYGDANYGGGGGGPGKYSMSIVGKLDKVSPLPYSGLGAEIIKSAGTLTEFRARRGVAGTSGTTTVVLELNGTPTVYSLSWTSSDADYALKTTAISVVVAAGDRLSLRLTSAEVKSQDLFSEANS